MLTYIPQENGKFLLTQNRDESIMRPIAAPPIKRQLGEIVAVYPVDPQGTGTWIGVSSDGRAAGLLNGGSRKHKHQPPYRHSRGLIIPAYFKHPDIESFFNTFNFDDLEPFTLVVVENGKVFEIIKEEQSIDIIEHNASLPLIRFSFPLYPADSIEDRSMKFYRWYYQQKQISATDIFQIHQQNRYELYNIPKHDTGQHILKTVSITQVKFDGIRYVMNYYDAVNDLHLFNSTAFNRPVGEHV
ncbi:MAG: NRDE family protein [Bacteroidetes bacterium]|nr:NRDE family protein [Bacteroidota bacterium]